MFISPAKKLSHHGRFSGGVIALIRKSLVSYMKRIDTETDSAIVFRIAEQLFGKAKPIVMVFTYLPPTQSPYYDNIQNDYGVELLENVLDICDNVEDFLLLLCGDFNSRTGTRNDTWNTEDLDDMCCDKNSNTEPFPRRSNYIPTNTFVSQLLDLCDMYQCIILNGLIECGFDEGYTYISKTGSSVIDYFIMSCELFHSVCVVS